MTLELYALIVSLGGVVIVTLLGIIAYFLKRLISRLDTMNVILNEVVLTTTVQKSNCKLIHEGVTARLDSHAKDIHDLKNNRNEK